MTVRLNAPFWFQPESIRLCARCSTNLPLLPTHEGFSGLGYDMLLLGAVTVSRPLYQRLELLLDRLRLLGVNEHAVESSIRGTTDVVAICHQMEPRGASTIDPFGGTERKRRPVSPRRATRTPSRETVDPCGYLPETKPLKRRSSTCKRPANPYNRFRARCLRGAIERTHLRWPGGQRRRDCLRFGRLLIGQLGRAKICSVQSGTSTQAEIAYSDVSYAECAPFA